MVSRLLDSAFAGLDISHGRNLDDDVSRARELLISLTSGPSPAVPPELLSSAKVQQRIAWGLAFSFSHEAALGISGMKGHGFAIANLQSGQIWSAPVFFKAYGAGIGLSAGYNRVSTLIAVYSDHAMETFTRKQATLGVDIGLASGRAYSASFYTVQGQWPGPGVEALEFSLADGNFVDISLKGVNIQLDTEYIERLYGREDLTVAPGRILRGEVPAPPEFEKLYSALRAIVSGTTAQSWGEHNRQAPAAAIRYSSAGPWGTWQPAGPLQDFPPQHRIAGFRSGPASYFDGSSGGEWSQSPGWGNDMGTDSHGSPLPMAGVRYPWPGDTPASSPGADSPSTPRTAPGGPSSSTSPSSPTSSGWTVVRGHEFADHSHT